MRKRNLKLSLLAAPVAALVVTLAAAPPAMAKSAEDLAKECADCHGLDGNSKDEKYPSIAEISETYFMDSMAAYKSDDRPAQKVKLKDGTETDMKKIANDLSAADAKTLAAYYAGKKFVRKAQSFDADKAKAGKKLHRKYCDKCHSDNGRSSEDDAGILAGQFKPYLRYAMDSYLNGERKMGKKMKKKLDAMLEDAGKESVEQLIHFYASQK